MLQIYKLSLTTCGVAVGIGLCYHTWSIEDRKKRQAQLRLNVGSIDDMTADRLKVGDIIVFERDCGNLHVPYAAHCFMTKKLLGESVDHVGIIYLDKRTSLPTVLEAIPWQGVFATPYQERIARGDESRISIVPIQFKVMSKESSNFRERRMGERINAFAASAQNSTKIPTKAKDSVGLVLNALLAAKVIDPDPKLHLVTAGDLFRGDVQLKEGAALKEPIPVRAMK